MPAIGYIVIKVLKGILFSFLTEKAIAAITFYGLEKLAESTDNKVDDELIKNAREAYYGK